MSAKLKSRCYKYTCDLANTQISISIASNTIICRSAEEGATKILSGMHGNLICPNFDDFCVNSRKICPNWCSQNGICTRGVCNCISGFYGSDCSRTACTTSQFYDPISGACLTTCPTGYYQNKFSRTCLKCDSICTQCRDEPHICTNCVSTVTNPQFYYAPTSTCLSACPDGTFRDND